MKVLITGGTGFVGRAVVDELVAVRHVVRLAVRQTVPALSSDVETVVVGEIGKSTDWGHALQGVDAVVHLAARAHVLRETESDPKAAFLATNYEGTKRLADACRGRVGRFVHLSSIGVYGRTSGKGAFNEFRPMAPVTPYGESKARAEAYLQELTRRGELDCRILRPPLVYGPNAPGNLGRLLNVVRRGLPLPLASIRNRRSLIDVEHLARAILAVLEADTVSKPAYVVADREVVSTPEIVRAIAKGLDRPARLWPLPVGVLKALGVASGRQGAVEQLVGDLEVDASAFRREFGDLQPYPTLEGLTVAARASH